MTIYQNSKFLSAVDPFQKGMMDEDRLEAIVHEKQRLLRHNPSPNPQVFFIIISCQRSPRSSATAQELIYKCHSSLFSPIIRNVEEHKADVSSNRITNRSEVFFIFKHLTEL